ncbi:CHAT domain-containing protein [Mycobacterium sp. PSTR-4-N]|uniref:CHAT domain-containing protein n=1 Tax=Mycobacterium sp. PSTR-4-N TaxID=2917745 RepID=UPI001F156051|nr:CHAT domain-containing protein [Mycobacterium sp. PSTR-4-N]MCG7594990.1 CHAT domain-containing protein [Mycobacterium sp. PSTR-4-N]
MRTVEQGVSVGTEATSAAQRILAGWPEHVRAADIEALSGLPADEARRLVDDLLARMPSGPLGATEAARLRALIDIIAAVGAVPTSEKVRELTARYPSGAALPESVARQLDTLQRLALQPPPVDPIVLGRQIGVPTTVVFADPPIDLTIDAELQDLIGEGFDAPSLPEPVAADPLPAPPTAAPPPSERFVNAEIEDHDLSQPLEVGVPYSVAIDVDTERKPLSGNGPLVAVFADTDEPFRELTVQVASEDFEILGQAQRPLQLPKAGPSRGKARFDVSPRRAGAATLTATVSCDGNFLTQLQLHCPVGTPGEFTATTEGRPASSATVLKSRDIGLVIRPAGDTFLCSAIGPFTFDAPMPLTVDALAAAAGHARAELAAVVTDVYGGSQVFLEHIDIPAEVQRQALKRLARAGRLLYRQLFRPAGGGDDLRSIGDWLARHVAEPDVMLTVQIVARQVPVPWSMLYLGDIDDDDALTWDRFLGMRHIVELLPFQRMPADDDPEIDSLPDLTLGLNINPVVSEAAVDQVAEHRKRCADLAVSRRCVSVITRSDRAEVVSALAADSTRDKVTYFYCHAKTNDADPQQSAIIMGSQIDRSTFATLADLTNDAPDDIPLAGRPLIVLNACESADLSPRFYDGFVPYFLSKGARGVIGTECSTPVLFAIRWAENFLDRLLDGAEVGRALRDVRLEFLQHNNNPLGLLYSSHCDVTTQITPPVAAAQT